MAKFLIALYVMSTSLALVFLKLGSEAAAPFTLSNGRPHINLNWYVSAGLLLYGTSFIVYTYLISKYDFGYIVPLATALVYTAIVISAYFIFHEAFTVAKIMGIVLILVGLILLNLKR
jgi:drug/metabolite transporter (DMT)-like permease